MTVTVASLVLASVLASGAQANVAGLANAQNLLKNGNYSAAAPEFFDILSTSQSVPERQDAEWGLAQALDGGGYQVAALIYYIGVFKFGTTHRHYVDSVGALVSVARALHDDFVVPATLNARFDADAFEKLDADKVNAINYMIGGLSYRQGKYDDAASLLSGVAKNAQDFLRAHYLLGVIHVRQHDNAGAIKIFDEVEQAVKADEDEDTERAEVRRLAILGKARCEYALGHFKEATALYNEVPRYTHEWFDAVFENGWAYYQQEDYGRALGQVESVLSPYFEKRFRPEAYVLAATVYYSNCQWDRTRGTLDKFRERYETDQAQLEKYLAGARPEAIYYKDLIESNASIPNEILRQVRRNGRFLNYHRIIAEITREQDLLNRADNARTGRLGEELKSILADQRGTFEDYSGKWVHKTLANYDKTILAQFINQARYIKFETATSEKEILEAGGDVAAKERKRLPRPDIPSDQYQHWNFKGEYWADELGYYVHGVRKECLE